MCIRDRREVVNVPIVGHVAAGEPILATENIENYFPIPVEYMPNEETFMLKVKGESMINAGIFNGDNVLVKKQPNAENEMCIRDSHKGVLATKTPGIIRSKFNPIDLSLIHIFSSPLK